jgi:hypothetical protein
VLVARDIFVVTRHADDDVIGHHGGSVVQLDHLDIVGTIFHQLTVAEVFENLIFGVELGIGADRDEIVGQGVLVRIEVVLFLRLRNCLFIGDELFLERAQSFRVDRKTS